jgi:NAD-dependent deacetylase
MKNLKQILEENYHKEFRNKFTFLTGAGLSSDSGIPTYRGVDGIWIKGTKFYKPEEFGTFKYFKQSPEEVWQYTLSRKKMFENAKPNESHLLIAEIEDVLGDRFHLITQNIDNLHQKAGSKRVYEVHGNIREAKCSNLCRGIIPLPDEVKSKDNDEDLSNQEIELLKCPKCGSWLRPNILWFDEYYDEKTNKKHSSLKIAKNSGVLFVLGTSGATNLPLEIVRTALRYGATVVDINIEDNNFTKLLENKKNSVILRKTTTDALYQINIIVKNLKKEI